jgi:phage/plasmid-like protein (TIGR03299 family)
MAHKLNKAANGTWSFASNSEVAWHGLGQVVNGAMTAKEVITLANLDYEVALQKLFIETPEKVEFPNRFATYRTDTNAPLGIVGSRYNIVQNRDAFGFFDAIIDEGEAIYETAGVLGNGERVFITAKLPNDLLIGGEAITSYILLTTSHDGTTPVMAGLTNIRVVCNNTLQAAMRRLTNKVTIHHVGNAKDKLAEAYRVMGIASKYNSEVSEIFNRMTDKRLTEEETKNFFLEVFKPEYIVNGKDDKDISTRVNNMVETTYQFSLTHPTQMTPEATGTLWGAYNAVSGYYNYCKEYKNTEEKFTSQYFGNANKKMLKSFELAQKILAS